MFYPFINLDDLMICGSYRNLFRRKLQLLKNNKITTFGKQGFTIIQIIRDRTTKDKNMKQKEYFITNETGCQAQEETSPQTP